ncbi:MAG: ABC transporter ATP-binding protein [Planctomycetota bacterium]
MTPPSDLAIHCKGLVKRYDDVVAVGGIDLPVPRGVCLALLGPNGAGKTTTVEILAGLLTQDAGEVSVLGLDWRKDARAIRGRIGVQLQETRFPDKITVTEILRLFRSFYSTGRDIAEVLEIVELTEKRDTWTVKLSGGQRQRLALGCALVNYPDILFLDEPTTGLDPQARRHMWQIIENFKAQGGTVLLTSHYMEEAERLADHVTIIDHGRIITEGSPHALITSLGAESIVQFSLGEDAPRPLSLDALQALPGVRSVQMENGVTSLAVSGAHESVPALLDLLRREGLSLADLRTHRPTLEDVFVALTGRHLRDT